MGNGKKVIKAGVGYIISNYLLKGLSFFTIPIFARLMSTADYGMFNTYAAYDSVLCIIVGMTLHSCFKNAKYKYNDKFEEFISTCILMALVSLGTWMILINTIYPLMSDILKMSRFVVNILLLNCIGNAFIMFYNSYVELQYEYKAFLKLALTNALSSVALSIFLILTVCHRNAALGRILGTALPVIAIGIYIICFFWKKQKPAKKSEYCKFALRFSGPTIPHGLSQVVLSQFDRIMITNMCGAAQSGLYSFGYNIYSLMLVTANSLDGVWGPWLFERLHKNDVKTVKTIASRYAFGIFVFSVIVMLSAPELIWLLGTEEYREVIYVVIPIVLGGFFSFLYTIPVQVEYYYEKTNYIAMCSCGAAVLNIILNWVFISRYGYIAAAYTTLVTYLIYFVFHYLIVKKIVKQPLFRDRDFIIIIILALCAGFIAIALIHQVFVRWGLIIAVIICYLSWAQKEYGILTKVKILVRK